MQGGKGEQPLLLAGWNPDEEVLPHPRKGSGSGTQSSSS